MAAPVRAFGTVMHRFVAVVAVVLVSGFLPLAAGAGFCAAKPCCRSHAQASNLSLGTHSECCNETNCSISSPPDTEATVHAKRTLTQSPVVTAALTSSVISSPSVAHFAQRFNVGSPPTQRRLAALSILLI